MYLTFCLIFYKERKFYNYLQVDINDIHKETIEQCELASKIIGLDIYDPKLLDFNSIWYLQSLASNLSFYLYPPSNKMVKYELILYWIHSITGL